MAKGQPLSWGSVCSWKDVNAGLKQPRLLQIAMTVCYLFALGITIYAIYKKF